MVGVVTFDMMFKIFGVSVIQSMILFVTASQTVAFVVMIPTTLKFDSMGPIGGELPGRI